MPEVFGRIRNNSHHTDEDDDDGDGDDDDSYIQTYLARQA